MISFLKEVFLMSYQATTRRPRQLCRRAVLCAFFVLAFFGAAFAPGIDFADPNLRFITCTGGGGTPAEIFEATEPTQVCVVRQLGENCQAILRGLGSNQEVIVQGEPKVACVTAKRAIVVCKGEQMGDNCGYQLYSIASVPNPFFQWTVIILLTLLTVMLLIFLLWR